MTCIRFLKPPERTESQKRYLLSSFYVLFIPPNVSFNYQSLVYLLKRLSSLYLVLHKLVPQTTVNVESLHIIKVNQGLMNSGRYWQYSPEHDTNSEGNALSKSHCSSPEGPLMYWLCLFAWWARTRSWEIFPPTPSSLNYKTLKTFHFTLFFT